MSFKKLVREIIDDITDSQELRLQESALEALQEITEAMIVAEFQGNRFKVKLIYDTNIK